MISAANGEIVLASGVVFTPQCELLQGHLIDVRCHQGLSIPGWTLHLLGEHESNHGVFEVQAVSDPACRIRTVLLSHIHPFYSEETPDDGERRAYHEGVLETDLGQMRKFFWGEVFCRVDADARKDWIVVAYNSAPKVPLRPPILPRNLLAHATLPELSPPEFPDDSFFVPKPNPRP